MTKGQLKQVIKETIQEVLNEDSTPKKRRLNESVEMKVSIPNNLKIPSDSELDNFIIKTIENFDFTDTKEGDEILNKCRIDKKKYEVVQIDVSSIDITGRGSVNRDNFQLYETVISIDFGFGLYGNLKTGDDDEDGKTLKIEVSLDTNSGKLHLNI